MSICSYEFIFLSNTYYYTTDYVCGLFSQMKAMNSVAVMKVSDVRGVILRSVLLTGRKAYLQQLSYYVKRLIYTLPVFPCCYLKVL